MPDFRSMRRKRQQLSRDDCLRMLAKATSGVLALLGDGDYPYAVPLSFAYAEGRIYFHSAPDGHKVDAVRRYDRASFCIVDQDEVHGEAYTTPLEMNACLPGCVCNATPRSLSPLERNIGFWTQA